MFVRKMKIKNSNDMYLAICSKYRNENGRPTDKTIENWGKLSELKLKYDDPIAFLEQRAKELTFKQDELKKEKNKVLILDDTLKSSTDGTNSLNFGFIVLSSLYHIFGFDKVAKYYQHFKSDVKVNHLNKILMFLIYNRILNPGSKLSDFNKKDLFVENFNFELHDIYKSLDHINLLKKDLISSYQNAMNTFCPFDLKVTHFDLTNYYVYTNIGQKNEEELSDEQIKKLNKSKLLKRGYSKEHSQYPIVQMALLTDANGLPINYKLFSGNRNDVSSVIDFFNEQKEEYRLRKTIIIGDAGIISNNNIIGVLKNRYGYIFKQSLLKLSKEEKSMFDSNIKPRLLEAAKLYPDKEILSISITLDVTREVIDIKGDKIKVSLPQKYLFTYSRSKESRDRHINDTKIENALELLNNSKKLSKKVSKVTNAFIDIKPIVRNNEDITYEAMLDDKAIEKLKDIQGFSLIVTSETKMNDNEIFKAYRNQYLIEESFKITKTDIQTRPTYLSLDNHLESHFLICFLSLSILRVLQYKLKREYSVAKIKEAIKEIKVRQIYLNTYEMERINELQLKLLNMFNLDADYRYMTLDKMKKIIGNSKKIKI